VSPQRLLIAAAVLAVAALAIVGLAQLRTPATTQPSRLTIAQMRASLIGSPSALAALHDQAGQILPGGLRTLRARLTALRGRPVVVNKWASWCGPCRSEFGVFQRVSIARGREVAFVGIDSEDPSQASAAAFLRSFPLSYPSYFDPSGQAGRAITDSTNTPVTVFFNRRGGQYIHQGPYLEAAALERDVRRYALGA
jgi:cytochrome c biogenesis protein CcmG, thiol:disulfide interchange protein DsbE